MRTICTPSLMLIVDLPQCVKVGERKPPIKISAYPAERKYDESHAS